MYSLILRCHLVLACSRRGLWYRILVSVKSSLAGPYLGLSSASHSYSFLLFLLDLVKFDKQVIARSTTATAKTAGKKNRGITKISKGPTQNIYKGEEQQCRFIYMVRMIEMDVSSIPAMVTNNIRASRYRISHGSSVSRVQ